METNGEEAPTESEVDRFPVVVRSVALAVIAVCAALWLLDWAAQVFIPVLLGLMFSYALTPIVDRLQSWHIPRVIGATVLLASIIGGTVATMYSMEDDANALIESLPDTAQKIREALRPQVRTPDSAIANVQEAATQIEQAAAETTPKPPAGGAVTRVQIETPRFDIKAHLWSGTLGLVALLGQAMVVSFVTFFLLVSGDTFRRKMAKIAGPTFKTKRITVEALDEITGQIKRYLLVQLFLSVLVGVATWLAFMWIGLAHAGVWGVLSGVLNLIPYFGAIAVTGGSALLGFVQFGQLETALIVAGASLVIHGIVGHVLMPWLTGRASRMNPVVVFVGVLAWGWLWGIWGLLLGMPIMLAIKAVCDRVEDLKPIGELLGSEIVSLLPRPTGDLDQAEHDIATYGLCLVEDVLSADQVQRARTALYKAAADDRAQGREQPRFGLDYGDANQRVWNVLNRDPVFADLVQHPAAVRLIRAVIGWPALLGNLSANIVGPGADASVLHADQIFVPEPWPAAPQGVNVAWCLDEFTAQNGGTRVVPRSHLRSRNPTPSDADGSVPIEAPLGTMMVFESRVWHRTGSNTTASSHRAGLFGWYTRPIYRTQENWFLALDASVRDNASDTLLQLLAYKTEGLGLVNGRSPM